MFRLVELELLQLLFLQLILLLPLQLFFYIFCCQMQFCNICFRLLVAFECSQTSYDANFEIHVHQ